MTATINEVDTDFLSILDFEYAPPCETPSGCDETAKWKVRVGCCGHVWLLGQKCVDQIIEWYGQAKSTPGLTVRCVYCSNSVQARTFIHSIERL